MGTTHHLVPSPRQDWRGQSCCCSSGFPLPAQYHWFRSWPIGTLDHLAPSPRRGWRGQSCCGSSGLPTQYHWSISWPIGTGYPSLCQVEEVRAAPVHYLSKNLTLSPPLWLVHLFTNKKYLENILYTRRGRRKFWSSASLCYRKV